MTRAPTENSMFVVVLCRVGVAFSALRGRSGDQLSARLFTETLLLWEWGVAQPGVRL